MSSAVISGIISNILYRVDDESATLYPSGKVQQLIFASLPAVNGYLGSSYSGNNTDGIISPEISGLADQAILELLVCQELLRKETFKAARAFTLTSFQEGDSKVSVKDSADYNDLYKQLNEELKNLIRQAKYTAVSTAPQAVEGSDRNITEFYPSSTTP